MTKNSLRALSSYFFLLVSVIIMICKSHFGEHFTTVKLSVCFIGTVTSLRQEWCSLPVWHQLEGLCLATDNNSVHIAIIFLLSFRSPRLSKLPGWVLKDGSTFLDKVREWWLEFSCHAKKATWQVGSWCCRSSLPRWLIPKVSLCTFTSQDVLAEQNVLKQNANGNSQASEVA